MSEQQPKPSEADKHLETVLGNLLGLGVLMAAVVVLAGGMLYLLHHGSEPINYSQFQREPAELRNPAGILKSTLDGQARGIIQLGLLLLIATPVFRVVFSVYAFARQYDYLYVVLTLLVLVILLYSLFGVHLHS